MRWWIFSVAILPLVLWASITPSRAALRASDAVNDCHPPQCVTLLTDRVPILGPTLNPPAADSLAGWVNIASIVNRSHDFP
ncbi:MAG TPA: hypothetical protein VL588_01085, partial [Bdellovibrionota bacterium]|nr:hypothetical protein [Bdellovibrionota bacterium]